MKDMVVGFMYDETMEHVLLMKKQKPVWQKGFLNGIGGKVEKGETPIDAMTREFLEETDYLTDEDDWEHCIVYDCFNDKGNKYKVHFFSFASDLTSAELECLEGQEDEPLVVVDMEELGKYATIYNLQWMIHMLADESVNFVKPVKVKMTGIEVEDENYDDL